MRNRILKFLVALFALCALTLPLVTLSGCGVVKPALRDANRVAGELLCAQAYAEKFGISLEDAQKIYCSVAPLLDPFLAAAQRAKDEAAPESFGVQAKTKEAEK